MARRRRAGALIGGLLLTPPTVPPAARAAAPEAPGAPAATSGGLGMVLDSSGSMAGPDGSGHTRVAAARTAVGGLVDALPDGYPTGLRVYGAARAGGCDDTTTVLRTRLAYGVDSSCETSTELFGQDEGATPLTSGVSREAGFHHLGGQREGRQWRMVAGPGRRDSGGRYGSAAPGRPGGGVRQGSGQAAQGQRRFGTGEG